MEIFGAVGAIAGLLGTVFGMIQRRNAAKLQQAVFERDAQIRKMAAWRKREEIENEVDGLSPNALGDRLSKFSR